MSDDALAWLNALQDFAGAYNHGKFVTITETFVRGYAKKH